MAPHPAAGVDPGPRRPVLRLRPLPVWAQLALWFILIVVVVGAGSGVYVTVLWFDETMKSDALCEAVMNGDRARVDAMLRNGGDPNRPGWSAGYSAMHWAAEGDHPELVATLVRHGADPNLETPTGRTPLMTAAFSGKLEPARALLAHGADPNYRNADGETPLSRAGGDEAMVNLLVKHGAKADPAIPPLGR